MAKFVLDAVLEALLTAARGNKIVVCAGQPIDRADVITRALTDPDAAAAALVGGDYSLANGDTSGRKQTLAATPDLPIASSGTADHVAVIDDTLLLVVTTMTGQVLTSGGTIDLNAFDHEVLDPA